MPYVMVPVPEEHVEDVMQYILRALSRAAIVPWDEESIAEVYDGVDEVSRSLLAFVRALPSRARTSTMPRRPSWSSSAHGRSPGS